MGKDPVVDVPAAGIYAVYSFVTVDRVVSPGGAGRSRLMAWRGRGQKREKRFVFQGRAHELIVGETW